MSQQQASKLAIGDWTVEPSLNRLSQREKHISIEPRLMDLLCYLSLYPGQIVSRKQLIDNIWMSVVGEGAVNRAIAELRNALGDDRRSPQYIETVPKRGYRLIATVEYLEESQPIISAKKLAHPGMKIALVSAFVILAAIIGTLLLRPGENTEIVWLKEKQLKIDSAQVSELSNETSPLYSPNGQMMASLVNEFDKDISEVLVRNLKSGSSFRLTDLSSRIHSLSWSPDSQEMAFINIQDRQCHLLIYSVAEKRLSDNGTNKLSCGIDSYGYISWGKSKNVLYYSTRQSASEPYVIYQWDRATGAKTQLTNPSLDQNWDYQVHGDFKGSGDLRLEVSPDKKTLVFLRDYYWGENYAMAFDIESKKTTRLFYWDYTLHWFNWSKDSQYLYFNNDPKSIVRFSLKDKTMQTILRHHNDIHSFHDAPQLDTHTFVERDISQQLVEISLPFIKSQLSDKSQTLTQQGVNLYPKFANHTDNLAFMSLRTGQPELFIKQGSERERQMTNFPYWLKHEDIHWSPDDKQLLTVVRYGIYSMDLDSGVVTQYTPSSETKSESSLLTTAASWSADGRWIYFASDIDGDWQVWRIPTEGKKVRRIEFGIETEYVVDAVNKMERVTEYGGLYAQESSDGKFLYYSKYRQAGIWRKPLSDISQPEVQVLSDVNLSVNRNWTLGDKGIYYSHRNADKYEVRFFEFDSQENFTLFQSDKLQSRYFTVNKDETRLVISQLHALETRLRSASESK